MKKAMKPLIIMGIIFCIIGTITVAVAASMGSTFNIKSYVNDVVIEDFYEDYEDDEDYDDDEAYEYSRSNAESFVGEFNAIDLDLGMSEVRINIGDEFGVFAVNQKKNYECYVKNNTLIVESGGGGLFNLSEALILEITVPEGFLLEKIDVDIGVGDIFITDIDCSKLDIDAGTGDVYYSGLLEGKATIDTGTGDVNLTLTGDKSEYNYKISTGVGDISVGEGSYQDTFGPAAEYKLDNKSNKKLDIDTGVGTVTINFN